VTAPSRCGGVILAGGRSSRMGTPKAWFRVGGEPMLARIARRLAAPTGLLAVRAPGQELPPAAARLVEDHVEGEGPVAGLAAGLAAVTSPLAVEPAAGRSTGWRATRMIQRR
jgi:molybdopterin-guanine dinucleotide biosynthesis protein A